MNLPICIDCKQSAVRIDTARYCRNTCPCGCPCVCDGHGGGPVHPTDGEWHGNEVSSCPNRGWILPGIGDSLVQYDPSTNSLRTIGVYSDQS